LCLESLSAFWLKSHSIWAKAKKMQKLDFRRF